MKANPIKKELAVKPGWLTAWLLVLATVGIAQPTSTDTLPAITKFLSLEPAPSFDKRRFRALAGTGTVAYAGLSTLLWKAWYQDYPLTKFHTFNDFDEWNQLDKAGHSFSTWLVSSHLFDCVRWTGVDRRRALWAAAGVGWGLVTTVEVMDGFSEKWGFSPHDLGFNTLGAGLFVSQELLWQEQRIKMKVSGLRPDYPTAQLQSTDGSATTTLDQRAAALYGTNFFNVILKDYNGHTVWATVNLHSFLPKGKTAKLPRWLNLAFGYGAGNLYGGTQNKWEAEDGVVFDLDTARYPRYRQFYLSPDVDWTRIPTRHRWLRVVFRSLNILKVPAPALELNTLGEARFHYLYW